nr:hypothetical protein [Tanacetum cinerariifolium]
MELYIQGKNHRQIILNSVKNGPLIWPTGSQQNGTVRLKTYEELSDKEKLQSDYDLKATNIVLQGLPPDVYTLVNNQKLPKTYRTELSCLCKALHCQSKNVSGKFVTNVKLARDLHTLNYDQLYAYLEQHKYTTPQYQQQISPPIQHVYSPSPHSNPYKPPHHLQQYPTTYPTNLSHTQPSVIKNAYPPPTFPQQAQAEFPQPDCKVLTLWIFDSYTTIRGLVTLDKIQNH